MKKVSKYVVKLNENISGREEEEEVGLTGFSAPKRLEG
jgi:hypothetical protein